MQLDNGINHNDGSLTFMSSSSIPAPLTTTTLPINTKKERFEVILAQLLRDSFINEHNILYNGACFFNDDIFLINKKILHKKLGIKINSITKNFSHLGIKEIKGYSSKY